MRNFKIKIILILGCLCILAPESLFSQDLKKEINFIKKNDSYIYAEGVASSESEAMSLAKEMLGNEIARWAETQKTLQGNSNFIVRDINNQSESITLPRGNMVRCFLYVKKSDIMTAQNVEVLSTNAEPKTIANTTNDIKTGVNKVLNLPVTIKELLPIKEYSVFAETIKKLKEENKITSYGRYASLSDPEICYLAIYDREGRILCILSPGHDRINLNSGYPDKITNYSGCGAIGFTLPE